MRVLAIGAHPDDLEILCGGTLARFIQQGDQVVMAVVTDGSAGSFDVPGAEIVAIRKAEAAAAAEVIGAEFVWMGFPDHRLFHDEPTRSAFIDLYRQARPDLVITHPEHDYHPDHRTVARLVLDARIASVVVGLKGGYPPLTDLPELVYMDTLDGMGFEPVEWVDISATLALKREMLLKHESQAGLMEELFGIDIVELAEVKAKYRGFQGGCRCAEAFRPDDHFPRRRTMRLLPQSNISTP